MKTTFFLLFILLFISTLEVATAAQEEKTKTLNAKEFSHYAEALCKKYNLSGPQKVTSLAERDSLNNNLRQAQVLKVIELQSLESDDAKVKEKVQSQIDALVKELKEFPSLQYKKVEGYVEPEPKFPPLAPSTQTSAPTILKGNPSAKFMYDSPSAVREQMELKHGKKFSK